MKNAWTKIKNWIKKNWLHLVAAFSVFATFFIGLCSGKRRRLEQDKQLCSAAESGIAKATESIESASRELDSAERTVEQLKQSIESSEDRVDDCQDSIGKLIRDTDDIEAILDKYNKRIEQVSETK